MLSTFESPALPRCILASDSSRPSLVRVCAWCEKERGEMNALAFWLASKGLSLSSVTHGICPTHYARNIAGLTE